ncbi:hypothetical protein [Streptomyces sp. NPDC002566]|uniref:hypothetical protein n=1 Tax=Streptomyces sp. NPDC002566 TaxID=3364650 RepID=UPI0036C5634A
MRQRILAEPGLRDRVRAVVVAYGTGLVSAGDGETVTGPASSRGHSQPLRRKAR